MANDPDLSIYDLKLFLLNPRWVKWFKKCFGRDDKTDARDAYYIAERTRTHRPPVAWEPVMGTLPLRFYTRLRFHLAQNLTREKCYFSAYLFLKANAYSRIGPFSDTFGVTSGLVLTQYPTLDGLADIPVEDLALHLQELGNNNLPDPLSNARKIHRVVQESFPAPDGFTLPLQYILDLTLERIRFTQSQLKRVNAVIANEIKSHPSISKLATIPGIGPVYSSGIGAEIGNTSRFLQGEKWDKKRKRYRPRNLRDAEDAIAKIAGLWWPRSESGDFEAEDRRMAKTGNRYLRYYLVEAADSMRKRIPEYTRFYARKYREASKHHHKRALVLTARKAVGLFVGLLHRNEAYRPKEAP
jgi:transposase